MKIISLGWGVQSFTLAAMVALGELQPIDAAIHADTTHERQATYEFAAKWTPWLEAHGVRVVTTLPHPDRQSVFGSGRKFWLPSFTGKADGSGGQLRRECTGEWKIVPMRRWLQANRNSEPIEQWLGISMDEYQRMKDSAVKYIIHRWPLIEKRMTRNDCVKWLEKHDLEVPQKSACTFCPYHNQAEWRSVMANQQDRNEAVAVDRAIRKARPPFDLYVHPARKPLEDIDFRTPQEKGQLDMFDLWNQECSGLCGV